MINKAVFEEKWKVIRSQSTEWWSLMAEYDLVKVLTRLIQVQDKIAAFKYYDWRNKMHIEILLLAIPAIILFGLCTSTERVASIRQSQRTPRQGSNTTTE